MMFSGRRFLSIWVIFIALMPFSGATAGDITESYSDVEPVDYRTGIEYLYPSEDDRNIKTVNLNIYRSIPALRKMNLSVNAGLTVTFADGDITQLEGDINKGTLREKKYDNRAAGIGPGLLADLRLAGWDCFALHLEGSGAVLLYSDEFPAGGDLYNFMWRAGPVIKYDIGNNRTIGIGYQWMHVSNGQGIGPHNPSYDAEGLRLVYSFVF